MSHKPHVEAFCAVLKEAMSVFVFGSFPSRLFRSGMQLVCAWKAQRSYHAQSAHTRVFISPTGGCSSIGWITSWAVHIFHLLAWYLEHIVTDLHNVYIVTPSGMLHTKEITSLFLSALCDHLWSLNHLSRP